MMTVNLFDYSTLIFIVIIQFSRGKLTLNSINKLSSSATLTIPNVWNVFGELAIKTNSSNLGQGFPDWDTPSFVIDAYKSSISHQYTRSSGLPSLVELLAKRYSLHLNNHIDPFKNIAITVGASQALFLILTTLLKPSDEIIIFDPYFELYTKQIALIGATPKFVPLGGKSATLENPWALDINALRESVTYNTKILLLNSPHNPTGKVFNLEELEAIAEVVRGNPQLIVVSDEVYKYTVYNPLQQGDASSTGHYHFSRLPGMWERTVTISSAGKTFSVTGWQVGWMIGPEELISSVQNLLPCVQFCATTPVQEALAKCMIAADAPYENYSTYYEWLRQQFASKRKILEKGLRQIGIEPIPSNGGFFLMAKLPILKDIQEEMLLEYSIEKRKRELEVADSNSDVRNTRNSFIEPYDWRYLKRLAKQHSVIGIPASPFFSRNDYDTYYNIPPLARFAFCKRDDTLLEAQKRLSSKNSNEITKK